MRMRKNHQKMPYEHPWMIDNIDLPMTVDITIHVTNLVWDCLKEYESQAR